MVVDECLSGRADGVQGVALGPGAPRGPLGPTDLDHPLAAGLQKDGQASAVATGTLHRPAAPTGHLRLGELEQATVTSCVCPDRRLSKQAAHHIGGSGGEGVAVGR
jgi:hypothetical protein